MRKIVLLLGLSFCLSAQAENSEKRLKAYYSPIVAQELDAYRRSFNQIYHLNDWVKVYRKAENLREKLAAPLNKEYAQHVNTPKMQKKQLDYAWASPFFPGLDIHFVAEGTMLELFVNYEDFGHLARKTPEPEDDQFIDLMLKAYGKSFKYYPLWFAQTWDYGGCSQLGGGLHFALLQEMEKNLQISSVFADEIKTLRDKLMDDILKTQFYCHPRKKVLDELNLILAKAQLNIAERQILQKRNGELLNAKNLEFNCLHGGNCHFG